MLNLTSQPVIDLDSAAKLLKSSVGDWEWLLRQIESENGYLRMPPVVSRLITNLNIGTYPLLYQDERAIGMAFLLAFIPQKDIIELDKELLAMSPEERGSNVQEFVNELMEAANCAEADWDIQTPEQRRAEFEAMSLEDQVGAIKSVQFICMSCLCGFYQVLSAPMATQSAPLMASQTAPPRPT